MQIFLILSIALLLIQNCILADVLSDQIDVIYYDFGKNLGSHVPRQIVAHLESVVSLRSYPLSRLELIESTDKNENKLILSLGNTTLSLKHAALNNDWEPDSFRLRVYEGKQGDLPMLLANGLPLDFHTHRNLSFSKDKAHYGAITASYAALEALGFAFLHPLEPYVPPILSLYSVCMESRNLDRVHASICPLDRIEQPTWPERAFHIHTQHPLELTEVLQGHDIPQFGQHAPHCRNYSDHRLNNRKHRAKTLNINKNLHSMYSKIPKSEQDEDMGPYCERWEDMVEDVNHMFEWAVANRLNKIEWLLLGNYKWGDEFAVREQRLRLLTALGHE